MSVAYRPRFAPLTPQTWPQDENRVPTTPGMPMPAIEAGNRLRARRESFTMSGTFNIPVAVATVGQQYSLYLPTDKDGDFWCDQIALISYWQSLRYSQPTPLATISIADARTGLSLTYPNGVPTDLFLTLSRLPSDLPIVAGNSSLPDGFRSTSVLMQPYCFTRAGGIQLVVTMLSPENIVTPTTIDIAFTGWKEYENASQ